MPARCLALPTVAYLPILFLLVYCLLPSTAAQIIPASIWKRQNGDLRHPVVPLGRRATTSFANQPPTNVPEPSPTFPLASQSNQPPTSPAPNPTANPSISSSASLSQSIPTPSSTAPPTSNSNAGAPIPSNSPSPVISSLSPSTIPTQESQNGNNPSASDITSLPPQSESIPTTGSPQPTSFPLAIQEPLLKTHNNPTPNLPGISSDSNNNPFGSHKHRGDQPSSNNPNSGPPANAPPNDGIVVTDPGSPSSGFNTNITVGLVVSGLVSVGVVGGFMYKQMLNRQASTKESNANSVSPSVISSPLADDIRTPIAHTGVAMSDRNDGTVKGMPPLIPLVSQTPPPSSKVNLLPRFFIPNISLPNMPSLPNINLPSFPIPFRAAQPKHPKLPSILLFQPPPLPSLTLPKRNEKDTDLEASDFIIPVPRAVSVSSNLTEFFQSEASSEDGRGDTLRRQTSSWTISSVGSVRYSHMRRQSLPHIAITPPVPMPELATGVGGNGWQYVRRTHRRSYSYSASMSMGRMPGEVRRNQSLGAASAISEVSRSSTLSGADRDRESISSGESLSRYL